MSQVNDSIECPEGHIRVLPTNGVLPCCQLTINSDGSFSRNQSVDRHPSPTQVSSPGETERLTFLDHVKAIFAHGKETAFATTFFVTVFAIFLIAIHGGKVIAYADNTPQLVGFVVMVMLFLLYLLTLILHMMFLCIVSERLGVEREGGGSVIIRGICVIGIPFWIYYFPKLEECVNSRIQIQVPWYDFASGIVFVLLFVVCLFALFRISRKIT